MSSSDDRPRFRPTRSPTGPRWVGPVALLLLSGALAVASRLALPPADLQEIIEVAGDVPNPGTYLLEQPTLGSAIRTAGGESDSTIRLYSGDRVVVSPTGAHVEAASNPLLVGLPVDPNVADATALSALPKVGPALAAAIVSERANAPFRDLEDLARVRGLSEQRVHELAPYLSLAPRAEAEQPSKPKPHRPKKRSAPTRRPPQPAAPMDLNAASAAELEALPGIGPALATRIVEYRAENGEFSQIEELERVRGIGPVLMARVLPWLTVHPQPQPADATSATTSRELDRSEREALSAQPTEP